MEENKPCFVSIFTHDGKKCLDGIAHIEGLNLGGELPKINDRMFSGELSCSFDLELTDEDRAWMKQIEDLLLEDTENQLKEFYEEVGKKVEHILRNYVIPPIKGEITKGKVRYRGLQVVWQETETYDAFVGVRQRDVLIFPDGKKIPWNSLVEIE